MIDTKRGHNLRFCAASGGRAASLPIACSGLALRRDRRLASHPARLAQKRKLWPRLVYFYLFVCTVLLINSDWAFAQQMLLDPTRPPTMGTMAAPVSAEAGTILQSVILPKQGKPLAIIDGKQVGVG